MNRKFELLVFDWDGTLADSVGQIVEIMNGAIADTGMEPRSAAQIRAIIGLGMRDALAALYPGLTAAGEQAVATAYRARYHALAPGSVRLFPGALPALDHLRRHGHLLAVATGKGRQGLRHALQDTGLELTFHATRTADETASKPAPQMLQELMAQFDVRPELTLMIGDSEHDLRMAANAGVPAVGVLSGAQGAHGLIEFGPLACLASVADLPAWLGHPIPHFQAAPRTAPVIP